MTLLLVVKLIHVIGAAVLLGTGAGIAFFMVMANRTADARLIAHTAGVVVLADTLFTATAVILQPLTGLWLANLSGYGLTEFWILASLGLYVVTGLFWLPVVWIQLRLKALAVEAADADASLPPAYHSLWRIWFACGFPAFAAVVAIFWLMIARPSAWPL
jgi:uncharacterized membrane protein